MDGSFFGQMMPQAMAMMQQRLGGGMPGMPPMGGAPPGGPQIQVQRTPFQGSMAPQPVAPGAVPGMDQQQQQPGQAGALSSPMGGMDFGSLLKLVQGMGGTPGDSGTASPMAQSTAMSGQVGMPVGFASSGASGSLNNPDLMQHILAMFRR